MSVKLLTEHHLEFLSLKGSCTGSSVYTIVKMPICWKSHATSHICRPPDKSMYLKIIFLISQPKHVLWVLKRTVSMTGSFEHPKLLFKLIGKEINAILGAQTILNWNYVFV